MKDHDTVTAGREAARAQAERERSVRHDETSDTDTSDAGPALPRTLAVLWRADEQPEAGRRGPRRALTVDGIASAAIALADAEGLGAVSMARVAESLGVTTMALYRYVSGKDELLAVMTDLAVGPPADAPTDRGWRAALERWCRNQLEAVTLHPWVARTTSALPQLGPNRLAWIESGLRALAGTPLSQEQRTEVIGAMSLHVLSQSRLLAAMAAPERSDHLPLLNDGTLLRRLVDPERHPAIVAALDAGAFDQGAPEEPHDAGFGLTLLLDGVEALITRSAGEPG